MNVQTCYFQLITCQFCNSDKSWNHKDKWFWSVFFSWFSLKIKSIFFFVVSDGIRCYSCVWENNGGNVVGDSTCNPISDNTPTASQLSAGKGCSGCQVREHCSNKIKLEKLLNMQQETNLTKTFRNLCFNEKI